MAYVLDLFLHVDRYLLVLAGTYGVRVYAILFVVVFAETGLIITPFLPGDSLLFATGALAAAGALDFWTLFAVLLAAAVAGDAVNYAIGRHAGLGIIHRVQTNRRWGRLVKPEYLARAHEFFERHGGKAVVLARFVPIVRTFVPFVAGVAEMSYGSFLLYNISGAIGWVGICLGAGYAFGNVPVVKENFSLVALGIVFVSLLPMLFEYLRHRRTTALR